MNNKVLLTLASLIFSLKGIDTKFYKKLHIRFSSNLGYPVDTFALPIPTAGVINVFTDEFISGCIYIYTGCIYAFSKYVCNWTYIIH